MNRALQGLGFQAGQFDSEAAQKYMSPYMQNVVDVQKEAAIRDAMRANAQAGRPRPFKPVHLVEAGQQCKLLLLVRH